MCPKVWKSNHIQNFSHSWVEKKNKNDIDLSDFEKIIRMDDRLRNLKVWMNKLSNLVKNHHEKSLVEARCKKSDWNGENSDENSKYTLKLKIKKRLRPL